MINKNPPIFAAIGASVFLNESLILLADPASGGGDDRKGHSLSF
jgi:hypothetical protein